MITIIEVAIFATVLLILILGIYSMFKKQEYVENDIIDEDDLEILKKMMKFLFQKYKMFNLNDVNFINRTFLVAFCYSKMPEVEYLFKISRQKGYYNFRLFAIDKRNSKIFNDKYHKIYEENKVASCSMELEKFVDSQLKDIYFTKLGIK